MDLRHRFNFERAQLITMSTTVLFVLFAVTLPRFTDIAKAWYLLLILGGFIYLLFNLADMRDIGVPEKLFFE